jgi:hypothetical protein
MTELELDLYRLLLEEYIKDLENEQLSSFINLLDIANRVPLTEYPSYTVSCGTTEK